MGEIEALLDRTHDTRGACLYSPAWTEAFLEIQNGNGPTARRELRAARREGGPIRWRVAVYDTRMRFQDQLRYDTVDECEGYGWRGALATARALRNTYYERRYKLVVLDARLIDAIDENLYGPAED